MIKYSSFSLKNKSLDKATKINKQYLKIFLHLFFFLVSSVKSYLIGLNLNFKLSIEDAKKLFINFLMIKNHIQFVKEMDSKSIAVITLLAMLLAAGVLYASNNVENSEYELWKAKYGFKFSATEEAYRMMIFAKNLEDIKTHNQDPLRTYEKGVNQFTGLTQAEFASLYLNPRPYNPEWENTEDTFQKLGADVDWTTQGKVSPVKNQGQCGSCWAFSAVGVLESYALFNGKTVSLSEQQLVDCSRKYGNKGCSGGFNYQGLAYVKDHGITTTANYPYVAKNQACQTSQGEFKISSVPSAKGCTGIQEAVKNRPIGVSVDAEKWSPYKSGIFINCGSSLDHDVLLVGFSDSYWKIKNSWGPGWGENGFIRLAPGNTCGICHDKSPWVA